MSAAATAEAEAAHGHGHGHGDHVAQQPWSSDQKKLAGKITVGFTVGFFMVGVVGPIALTVVIGLLQGYHRF